MLSVLNNLAKKGHVFVISAPSGAGKSSLVSALCKKDDTIKLSISHTTRKMRHNEINGVNYFFISEPEFKNMIDNKDFLEYAKVYDNYYGTSIEKIKEFLENGQDTILEIDYQGAIQVKNIFPDAILIFIAPPSLNELENRLRNRNTDHEEVIKKRMSLATIDLSYQHKFDHIIINDNFHTALDELYSIIMLKRSQ